MNYVYTFLIGEAVKATIVLKLSGFPTFITPNELADFEAFASPYFTLRYTDNRKNYEKIYEEACEPFGHFDCTTIPQPVVTFKYQPVADVRFSEVDMVVEFTLIAQEDFTALKKKLDPAKVGKTFDGAARDVWSKDFADLFKAYADAYLDLTDQLELDRQTGLTIKENTKLERLKDEIAMIRTTISMPIMKPFIADLLKSRSKPAALAVEPLLEFVSGEIKSLNPFPGGLFSIEEFNFEQIILDPTDTNPTLLFSNTEVSITVNFMSDPSVPVDLNVIPDKQFVGQVINDVLTIAIETGFLDAELSAMDMIDVIVEDPVIYNVAVSQPGENSKDGTNVDGAAESPDGTNGDGTESPDGTNGDGAGDNSQDGSNGNGSGGTDGSQEASDESSDDSAAAPAVITMKANLAVATTEPFSPELANPDSAAAKKLAKSISDPLLPSLAQNNPFPGGKTDVTVTFEEVTSPQKRRRRNTPGTKANIEVSYTSDPAVPVDQVEIPKTDDLASTIVAASKTALENSDVVDKAKLADLVADVEEPEIPSVDVSTLQCDPLVDIESFSEVFCSPSSFGVKIPLCAFKNLEIEHLIDTGMYLTGDDQPTNCLGTRVGEFVIYETAPDQCNTATDSADGKLTYTSGVTFEQGNSNSVISRKRKVHVAFECSFDLEIQVSLTDGFTSSIVNIEAELESGESEIGVEMALFEDDTFATQLGTIQSDTVHYNVPDVIHIGLSTQEDVHIQLEKCWATPR